MLTSGRHFTGGLYGFFTTLAKTIRETEATALVVCKDSKPYLRSEEYPAYKQLRKGTANEELLKMHKASMRLIEEVLVGLGLPLWGIPGFESDDLIGFAARKYRHRFERIYAASNDSDLFQLLHIPNFAIYTKDIENIWTGQLLMEKHGVTSDQYMLATAMTGTHNDIEGIAGVGVVTAVKAAKDPAKLRALMDKHGPVIERNLNLIKLPHRDFPGDARIPRASGEFDPRALYRLLGRYDIEVTATMARSLEQVAQ